MKETQNAIKQNIQGTSHDRKETRMQSNDLEQKEEINSQQEQNEETRSHKSEESLTNLWDNLTHSNIWIIGVPEREQQQEIVGGMMEGWGGRGEDGEMGKIVKTNSIINRNTF